MGLVDTDGSCLKQDKYPFQIHAVHRLGYIGWCRRGYIVDSTEPSLGRNSKILLLSNVEISASVSFESILLLLLNPLLRSNTRGFDMK